MFQSKNWILLHCSMSSFCDVQCFILLHRVVIYSFGVTAAENEHTFDFSHGEQIQTALKACTLCYELNIITIMHLTQISFWLHCIIVYLDYRIEYQPFQTEKWQPLILCCSLQNHTAVHPPSGSKILTWSNLSSSERKWGKSVLLHGSPPPVCSLVWNTGLEK